MQHSSCISATAAYELVDHTSASVLLSLLGVIDVVTVVTVVEHSFLTLPSATFDVTEFADESAEQRRPPTAQPLEMLASLAGHDLAPDVEGGPVQSGALAPQDCGGRALHITAGGDA
eukprot:1157349-Pelagomonas_calceolata.AAC.21